MDATQSYADVALENATFTGQPTPSEVFTLFSEMAEEVQKMSREQVEALSDEEILELGAPIRLATEGTIQLSEKTLQQLREPLGELTDRFLTMPRDEHRTLSSEIDKIIASDGDGGHEKRSLTAGQIRDVLMELSGGMMTLSSTCEQMFTIQGDRVILMPGDNFNLANSVCPAGTPYNITGTHYGQSVSSSKTGNSWIGGGSAVMDGQNTTASAFNSGMTGNSISWIEIRNYSERGIFSQSNLSTNIIINNMTFKNIGGNADGSVWYSAIYFRYVSNVLVQHSYFNNVTQSIRFRESNGPIQVLNNEALNTGFGFFQCIECEGNGNTIKINNNSLEHSFQYGPNPLRDFINIFKSDGSNSSNRIQVNNNRARINLVNGNASGVHDTGCFIILGDIGGTHQEAKNNIGVNPGNCGIGTAGGSLAKVENNKIFSQRVNGISNVGIYAQRYPPDPLIPCNHPPSTFSNNRSSYICGQHQNYGNSGTCGLGSNNFAYASPSVDQYYCGILFSDIRNPTRVLFDPSLSAAIWNDW